MFRYSLIIGTFVMWTSLVSAKEASWFPDNKTRNDLRPLLKTAIEKSESFENRFDAEVWLFDMSGRMQGFVPDKAFRLDLLRSIHREAGRR